MISIRPVIIIIYTLRHHSNFAVRLLPNVLEEIGSAEEVVTVNSDPLAKFAIEFRLFGSLKI